VPWAIKCGLYGPPPVNDFFSAGSGKRKGTSPAVFCGVASEWNATQRRLMDSIGKMQLRGRKLGQQGE